MRTVFLIFVSSLLATLASSAAQTSSATALRTKQIDDIIAAARAAAGTKLHAYVAMTRSGTFVQNGGSNAFHTTIDLRNGHWRTEEVIGRVILTQGYDGAAWDASSGPLTIVSLPSLVADARTQEYLNSYAFFRPAERSTITSGLKLTIAGRPTYVLHVDPPGGSPAELYFDGVTSRLMKIVAFSARGIDTVANDDFRIVQGITLPMRSIDVDSTGETTTFTTTAVRFAARLEPEALARPKYVAQGTVAASIPFTSDAVGDIGHIVVPVTIDGKGTSMIFDSGGSNLIIPSAAVSLGLKPSGSVAVRGAGQEQMASFAPVSSVDFGGATLSGQNFIVMRLPYAFEHPRKDLATHGLIGFQYLANFRLSVRYADQRIDLEPFNERTSSRGVALPLKSDGAYAYVEATIDGVLGYYLIDTGSGGGIVLNSSFAQAHHLFNKDTFIYKTQHGVGEGFATTLAAAKSFSFAGHTFHNVPVIITDLQSGSFPLRGVAGSLGASFLSRFTCVFDYKSQIVTFIPNRRLSLRLTGDRTGLSLNQNGREVFDVVGVVPNGPAAKAGIKPGDHITAFAGKKVSDGYGVGDVQPYLSGKNPFSVTFSRAGASQTVTITPRSLLPTPQ